VFQSAINLSEGRNPQLLEQVRSAMQGTAGVVLADLSMDPDHNRMVVSLLGHEAGLQEAVQRLFQLAEDQIDLSQHTGVHPRIGAVDVVPFVPLGPSTLESARQLSEKVAAEVARRFEVPVLLYEYSARSPERRNLPDLRKQGLQERLNQSPPDYGPSQLHPRLGASVMGARKPLVAFNVVLESRDLELARAIARHLRSFPSVRSLGFWLESQQKVQVSVNLTDPEQFDLDQVYEEVLQQAARAGVEVHSSELIGLAPASCFARMARHRLKMHQLQNGQVLEWNFLHQALEV